MAKTPEQLDEVIEFVRNDLANTHPVNSDTARMDWCAKNKSNLYKILKDWLKDNRRKINEDLREMIDKAMEESK
jgi:hypothetical protein